MNNKYLLGLDVGSSSVKASLVNVETGAIAATAFYPEHEAPIMAKKQVGQSKILKCGGQMQNFL